jgi:hypothetical protein
MHTVSFVYSKCAVPRATYMYMHTYIMIHAAACLYASFYDAFTAHFLRTAQCTRMQHVHATAP